MLNRFKQMIGLDSDTKSEEKRIAAQQEAKEKQLKNELAAVRNIAYRLYLEEDEVDPLVTRYAPSTEEGWNDFTKAICKLGYPIISLELDDQKGFIERAYITLKIDFDYFENLQRESRMLIPVQANFDKISMVAAALKAEMEVINVQQNGISAAAVRDVRRPSAIAVHIGKGARKAPIHT